MGLSTDVVFAAANREFKRNLIWLVGVGVAAILLALWISDILVLRRVQALATAAKRLGEGDLSARSGLPHRKREEIGQLASSFDHMANGLQIMSAAMQRVHRALQTLSACNRVIVGTTQERQLLDEICRTIVTTGGYRYAWIGYAEHTEARAIRTAAQFGNDDSQHTPPDEVIDSTWTDGAGGRGLVATAIRTLQPCVAHKGSATSNEANWAQAASRYGFASGVAFPLSFHGKAMGALLIYAAEDGAFNAEERELLAQAAQDIAVGVSMLRTRVEHDQALEHMAYFDGLTGLPNRAQLENSLRRAIANANHDGESLALTIVDIARLWEVNDAMGFHHGDQLLKEIGARIRNLFGAGIVVARMRGDEFSVVLPGAFAEDAVKAVQRIMDALKEPFSIGDLSLEVGAVAGVSLYPQHGQDAPNLIRHADVAMHQAKKSGKGYAFYTAEDDANQAKRLTLVGELRRAIKTSELVLYYQPKIDMISGQMSGMEALVRWVHPARGMIPPDEFISLAEQTGLINPLTEWVIRAALKQSATWRKVGLSVPIAVNLSARSLRDLELPEKIRGILSEFGAAPEWLQIEITEGGVMEDTERALEILWQLSAMGIKLFIDDFGTGYSSLGYLKKLPVDAVKIDKSFVIDMLTDADSAKIVRSTIGLAHDLDLAVVAEGVENQAVWDQLASLGCDVAQGYHISKPLPAEQVLGHSSTVSLLRAAS